MNLNGETMWQAICKAVKGLFTPTNKQKAIQAMVKELNKLAEKEKQKAGGKAGDIVIGTAAFIVCIVVPFFVGMVSRGGFYDRANRIEVNNSTNVTITATVSPSGGGSLSIQK